MNKIDLSCIVGSQVLCEFWDNSQPHFGWLHRIEKKGEFIYGFCSADYIPYKSAKYCKIVTNHWISNADGKLVLPDGLKINVQTRDNRVFEGITKNGVALVNSYTFRFNEFLYDRMRTASSDDIIAVQVTGVADGWEW